MSDDINAKEQKDLKKEYIKKENLKEKMQANDKFLFNVTQNISNSLLSINSNLNLLDTTKLDNLQKSYIEELSRTADNIKETVSNANLISKINLNTLEISKTEFNLKDEIGQILNNFVSKAHNKNLKVVTNLDTKLPNHLNGDVKNILKIIEILFHNAIKFTKEGGISFNVKLLNIDENIAKLSFELSDTGIGIDNEMLKNIFEPYSNAYYNTFKTYGGSGLGLFIAKLITSKINSEISVISMLNKGSRFIFNVNIEISVPNTKSHIESVENKIDNSKQKKEDFSKNLLYEKHIGIFLFETGSTKEYANKMFYEYFKNLKATIDQVNDLVENSDFVEVMKFAYHLKGSSYILRIKDMANLAVHLEEYAKSEDKIGCLEIIKKIKYSL